MRHSAAVILALVVAVAGMVPAPAARAACAPLDMLATVAVGSGPREVVVDAERQRIYVASHGAGTVSVIDSGSLAVVHAWPLSHAVRAMALDPSTGRLYLSYAIDGEAGWPTQLWSVDAESGAHLSGIWFAWMGDALAVNPSLHRVYIAGRLVGPNATSFERLAAIDGDVTRVLGVIASAGGLTHFSDVAVDGSTGAVYAARHDKYPDQSYVVGFDADLEAPIAGIRFGNSTAAPESIAIDAVRRRAILTMAGLWIVDIGQSPPMLSWSTEPRIDVAARPVVAQPLSSPIIAADDATGVIYAATRDGLGSEPPALSAIDGLTAREVARVALFGGARHRLAVDSVARRVLVTNEDVGTVSVFRGVRPADSTRCAA